MSIRFALFLLNSVVLWQSSNTNAEDVVTGRIVADIAARRTPELELAGLHPDRFRKDRRQGAHALDV